MVLEISNEKPNKLYKEKLTCNKHFQEIPKSIFKHDQERLKKTCPGHGCSNIYNSTARRNMMRQAVERIQHRPLLPPLPSIVQLRT